MVVVALVEQFLLVGMVLGLLRVLGGTQLGRHGGQLQDLGGRGTQTRVHLQQTPDHVVQVLGVGGRDLRVQTAADLKLKGEEVLSCRGLPCLHCGRAV